MKPTTELLQQLKSAAQEEIMCREAFDTSDAWQDLASPENILALIEIALPVLEQQGGWISCSERMPEINSTILVHMEDPTHSSTPYAVATYDKYGFSRSKVTHWQPLPAPPQQSTTQIDNDDWIEWGGGECPVNAGDMVETKLRKGNVLSPDKAIRWDWKWREDGSDWDIVAYRVIENDGREG